MKSGHCDLITMLDDTASELALVANRLASEPAHPHAVPWQTTLRQSLASTLARGQDDLLARTLEQCRGSRSAFEIVRRAGIAAVECPDVVLRGNRTRARVLLLPVHEIEGTGLRFGRLPRSPAWFRLQELIVEVAQGTTDTGDRKAPAFAAWLLGDYFYHPEEFRALPASAVLRSAQAMVDLSAGMAVSRGALLQAGAPVAAAREAARGGGHLGYLLAVGVLRPDAVREIDPAACQGAVGAPWLADAAEQVGALLGRPAGELSLSPPAGFYCGLKAGEQFRRVLQFVRDVPPALARAEASIDSARVLVAVHANDGAAEVRVSLCVAGLGRPLLKSLHRADDPGVAEAIILAIRDRLATIGTLAVERVAGTLRLEPGIVDSEDLRRRRFPMPTPAAPRDAQ